MNHRILQALCVASLTLGATSCNDFLDVQPKGELPEDVQFKRSQGFYDAMYGVYGTMASSNSTARTFPTVSSTNSVSYSVISTRATPIRKF
mgnify:CR=1 FL=1